jgi:phosphopantothenoylcysteine decarboxylase
MRGTLKMNRQSERPENGTSLPCGNLLVGVTGSVGVLNVPQYLLQLRQSFASEIHVMMSRASLKFLPPYALRLVSGNPVFTDTFQQMSDVKVPHIELTRMAELFLIMPATANIIGKAANGICDDLISTSIVASEAPVVFAPSMNGVMWSNKAVQQNVQRLKILGYHVLEPSYGHEISDMRQTYGAMPPLQGMIDALREIITARSRNVLTP